jgi:hypothetical protein
VTVTHKKAHRPKAAAKAEAKEPLGMPFPEETDERQPPRFTETKDSPTSEEKPPVRHKHPPQPVPPIKDPEAPKEEHARHWYPPSSHPAIGTVVEIDASGEVVEGRHHEGMWMDKEGNTLNIQRWRHK